MNILFTVCGRAGSKGAKSKNIRKFLGVPLVNYSLAGIALYCEQHPGDTIHTCLNTDSDELVRQARAWGGGIEIIPRKPEQAGDTAAKMPVIQSCLSYMEKARGISYDCVVDLDNTSPIRTVGDIRRAIEKRETGNYDVVFSVTEARRSPYFNMVKENPDGSCGLVIPSEFTARQQLPALFDMNASIYCYSPEFLRNNTSGMLMDGLCSYIEMPDTGIIDIDSERDFILMEVLADYLRSQDRELKKVYDKAHAKCHPSEVGARMRE